MLWSGGLVWRGVLGLPGRGRRRCLRCERSGENVAGLACPDFGHQAPSERLARRRRRSRGSIASGAIVVGLSIVAVAIRLVLDR